MSTIDPEKAKRIVVAIRRKDMAFQIMKAESVSLDAIYRIADKNHLPLSMQNGVLSPEECRRRYARKTADIRRRKTHPPALVDVMLAGIAEEDE